MDRTKLSNEGLRRSLENRRKMIKSYFKDCPQALDYIEIMEQAYGDHALGWARKLNYWQWNSFLPQSPFLTSNNLMNNSAECYTAILVSDASAKPLIVPYEMEFKIETYLYQYQPTPNAPNLNDEAITPFRGGLTFWLASGENTAFTTQLPHTGGSFSTASILPDQHNNVIHDDSDPGVVFFGSGMNPTSTEITYGVTNGTNSPNTSTSQAFQTASMTAGTIIRIKEIVPGQIKVIVGEVEIPIITTYGDQVKESLIGKTRVLGIYLRAGDLARLVQIK